MLTLLMSLQAVLGVEYNFKSAKAICQNARENNWTLLTAHGDQWQECPKSMCVNKQTDKIRPRHWPLSGPPSVFCVVVLAKSPNAVGAASVNRDLGALGPPCQTRKSS